MEVTFVLHMRFTSVAQSTKSGTEIARCLIKLNFKYSSATAVYLAVDFNLATNPSVCLTHFVFHLFIAPTCHHEYSYITHLSQALVPMWFHVNTKELSPLRFVLCSPLGLHHTKATPVDVMENLNWLRLSP